MRLSKQERIGALIILAVVILALGAFLLVKPKIEAIGSANATLASKETELKNAREKADLKPGLRTKIEAAYQEGEHLADMFFPELKSYESEEAFRAFLEQCGLPVVVQEITVSEPTTSTLEVAFFNPEEVTYALKTYVTQGIETTDDSVNSRRMSALRAALQGSQEIGSSTVEFAVSARKCDDIIRFFDEVNNYFIKDENVQSDDERGIRKAVMVQGVEMDRQNLNIIYDAFVEADNDTHEARGISALAEIIMAEAEPNYKGALGEPVDRVNPSLEGAELAGYYTYDGSVVFFSIERMQNPKTILDEQDGIVSNAGEA